MRRISRGAAGVSAASAIAAIPASAARSARVQTWLKAAASATSAASFGSQHGTDERVVRLAGGAGFGTAGRCGSGCGAVSMAGSLLVEGVVVARVEDLRSAFLGGMGEQPAGRPGIVGLGGEI